MTYTNGHMLRLRVTTKSDTQRLLPIKWILRDIISNQINLLSEHEYKDVGKVTYSERLISDN